MLDEEMDNIIRQAAEQHHPSYDNKAWDKMEHLLDQHLPQRKDRRGFIFFLLLAVLIGGGLFVGGYYFYGNKKGTVASNETKKEPGGSNETNNVVKSTPVTTPAPATAEPATTNPTDNSATAQNGSSTVPTSDNNAGNNPTTATVKSPSNKFTVGKTAAKTNIKIIPSSAVGDENVIAKANQKNNKPSKEKRSLGEEVTTIASGIIANADKTNVPVDEKKNVAVNKEDVQPALKPATEKDIVKDVAKEKVAEPANNQKNTAAEKKKTKQSIAGNFGLSFSAGPDISYVELNKPGKVTLSYGVGLSYTFIKKLTLQTGFYVSKKLYSADSANYKAPGGFWSAYPNMDNNVDANCKVYEVPVNLLYNFGSKKKHNWFAGAGLSTLFMKSETYDYSYSYFGQVYPKSYSIQNENQHNFSVLTLTGGYQYNISPRISVSAQPYVKLPLKGIGFGKVQLKGSGAMLNITVKPFAKGNKK